MKRILSPMVEQGRATEWVTSTVMLLFAVALSLPGDTLAGTGWRAFRAAGLDEAALAMPLSMIATARLAALYINGAWRRSPLVRMIGAIVGTVIFLNLAGAFAVPWITDLFNGGGITRGASTAMTTYFTLAASDCLAAYRSGADVRAARGGTYGVA